MVPALAVLMALFAFIPGLPFVPFLIGAGCLAAAAWLAGQDHVTPENVRAVAPDVLRHRLILSYEANADRASPDAVLDRLISLVAVA